MKSRKGVMYGRTDERTLRADERTDNPKAICPPYFFEVVTVHNKPAVVACSVNKLECIPCVYTPKNQLIHVGIHK